MNSGRIFVIDGYNVMRSCEPYASLWGSDAEVGMARLVSDIAAHTSDDRQAIIVFDGGANPLSDGKPHEIAGVTVIFSPYGVDADAVIEREVSERRGSGYELVVVTSDIQTQRAVMGKGVTRMSSAGFAAEISADLEERAEAQSSGAKRITVADLLDSATRESLARWSRGER